MLKKLAIAIASAFGLTLVNKTQAKVRVAKTVKMAKPVRVIKRPDRVVARAKRITWEPKHCYAYGAESVAHMTVRQFLNHALSRTSVAVNPTIAGELKTKAAGVALASTARRFSLKNGVELKRVKHHFRSTFSNVRTYHPSALCEAFEFLHGDKLTASEIHEVVSLGVVKLTVVPKLAA